MLTQKNTNGRNIFVTIHNWMTKSKFIFVDEILVINFYLHPKLHVTSVAAVVEDSNCCILRTK